MPLRYEQKKQLVLNTRRYLVPIFRFLLPCSLFYLLGFGLPTNLPLYQNFEFIRKWAGKPPQVHIFMFNFFVYYLPVFIANYTFRALTKSKGKK
jgi:hypothetical protein